MSNRGAVVIATALTAFVLVVAGGIVGRLSKPVTRPTADVVVASRAPQQRLVRPAAQTWHEEDEHERHHGRRHEEHEDDDD